MTESRKDEFLRLINLEIGKAKISTEKTSADVKTFGKYSWSESGDKYHSESAAALAKEYFSNLNRLKKEVEDTSNEPLNSAIPISYIELSYQDGEKVKFYFVKSGALLPGILLITPSSPIGKAIYGKKEGDAFSYLIKKGDEEVKFSGKVNKIE